MKKKSKKQKVRRKKEFRYHSVEVINKRGTVKRIKHPSYIFLEKGNIYIYVSITHSNNVKDVVVIKLRKNPNPKDKRESYRTFEAKEDTKDKFGKRLRKWSMDPEDDDEIRKEYKKR